MNATARGAAVLTAVALASCAATQPVPRPADGTTGSAGMSSAALLAAVEHDADAIDRATDPTQRAGLLAAAAASAQQCLREAPDEGACHYAQAQVLGLTARSRPLEASSLLGQMLASLGRAEARDPGLDRAGPARLTAILLLRAPPWPLGPGDVEAAVTAAQRAVQRDPAYPPNLITLGQAQAKAVGAAAARATFARAQQAAQAWTGATSEQVAEASADRARWQGQIEQGLRDLQ